MNQIWLWVLFNIGIAFLLLLDLKVFHRNAHEIKMREALLTTAFWVSLALLFCVGVYFFRGREMAFQFLAGYLIEESLSVDNLFVFIIIFNYFCVPHSLQHRILFWGIVGALVMRGIFIYAGVALLNRFEWLIYLFGSFLLFTGFKLLRGKDEEVDPSKNIVLKLVRRFIPCVDKIEGEKFFLKIDNKWFATPLFIVLLIVETTDVIFAVDSVPAVLAISKDPFIVYSSNIFAILGLRSLYFALAGLMKLFHYLHYGLGIILMFVGTKMIVNHWVHIPIGIALGFIILVLTISVLLSVILIKKEKPEHP